MDTTSTIPSKLRTITLTDRPPVKIAEKEWPIIASAESYSGTVEAEANKIWGIKIREHADGRRLVYGYLQSGPGGVPRGWRGWSGGRLIGAGDEAATIAAIHECAGAVGDDLIADEVIADLPAEAL